LKYAVSAIFTGVSISEIILLNSAKEDLLTKVFDNLSDLSKGNKNENATISVGANK
jgi:hypothetical protein